MILGGGFAGLWAARGLRRAAVDVVVIDRQNHHLFQPLLYQVATAALSPAHIAAPIRKVLSRQKNARVMLGEVVGIDAGARTVSIAGQQPVAYDYLIVATGVTHSYFGNEAWARHAPGLKSVDDALEIRRRFLLAFERAELQGDPEKRRAELTFVVVGGGPTGVELAGAMAEISRMSIPRDFRSIDTRTARVILVEAQARLLMAYPEDLSQRAQRDLERLGVQVWLNTRVTGVDERGVSTGAERLEAQNVFWAAGMKASPLGAMVAESTGAAMDRAGRVMVREDLSVAGYPSVFVAGDLASLMDAKTGEPVPGVAQGAMQMGAHAARIIWREVAGVRGGVGAPATPDRPGFRYHDKGILATIGRGKAVGVINGVHVKGMFAFQVWAFIHVLFLIGFRSRIMVLAEWIWMFFFFDRGARLITGQATGAGEPGTIASATALAVGRGPGASGHEPAPAESAVTTSAVR